MRRTLVLLALLSLFFGQAVLTVYASGLACEDACRDDAPLGCSGDEGCCTCCFQPRTTLPQAVTVARLDAKWSEVPAENPALPLASPREILHVPRALAS